MRSIFFIIIISFLIGCSHHSLSLNYSDFGFGPGSDDTDISVVSASYKSVKKFEEYDIYLGPELAYHKTKKNKAKEKSAISLIEKVGIIKKIKANRFIILMIDLYGGLGILSDELDGVCKGGLGHFGLDFIIEVNYFKIPFQFFFGPVHYSNFTKDGDDGDIGNNMGRFGFSINF